MKTLLQVMLVLLYVTLHILAFAVQQNSAQKITIDDTNFFLKFLEQRSLDNVMVMAEKGLQSPTS